MRERYVRTEKTGELQGDNAVELPNGKEIGAEEKNAVLLGCLSRRWKYHGLRVRQGLESVRVTSGEV